MLQQRGGPGLFLPVLVALMVLGVTVDAFLLAPTAAPRRRLPAPALCMAATEPEPAPAPERGIPPLSLSRSRELVDRGAVLQRASMGAAVVGGLFLNSGMAVAVEEAMMVSYDAPSKVFSFDYPDSWVLAPKPLQTHQEEVTLKSTTMKGFSAGVAVDPVRIDRVTQAGTPAEVGGRIVALEGKKEGVGKVELLGSGEDGDYYAFDYAVESTRGKNRYLARATVVDKKLVVFTVQVPIAGYEEQERLINKMLASFRAPPPK